MTIQTKTNDALAGADAQPDTARDQALGELRTSQDLQKVVDSIERFLLNQIDRLQATLNDNEKIAAQGEVVQRLRIDFEQQKKEWEQQRDSELREINAQKSKLAQGLRALEDRQ